MQQLISHKMSEIEVVEDIFGILEDPPGNSQPIKRFTLTNRNGMVVQLITYGATLTSIKVPDKNGQFDDIILGFDDMEGYLGHRGENPYFGGTIGRVTNRIANASFDLDGDKVKLSGNGHDPVRGDLHKHGGFKGFDKQVWEGHVMEGKGVTLSYLSKDGEEGYPGDLLINVSFELSPHDNELSVRYQGIGTKRTPVALTINPNFNLSGHQNAHNRLVGHLVQVNADNYTAANDAFMPTGEIVTVEGTEFDFRASKNLSKLLEQFPLWYNHNFCVNGPSGGTLRLAARVEEENNGRSVEIWSDQPGIQFYNSYFLPQPGRTPIIGKEDAKYFQNGAFCLQTQNYPNAVNYPNFPDPILSPGDVYRHQIKFRFLTM